MALIIKRMKNVAFSFETVKLKNICVVVYVYMDALYLYVYMVALYLYDSSKIFDLFNVLKQIVIQFFFFYEKVFLVKFIFNACF